MKATEIILPDAWPEKVKRSMLYTLQLARFAMIITRGKTDHDYRKEVRQKAEIDKLKNEVALEKDLRRICAERFERVPPKKRPYYSPVARMEILNHKAARGWNLKQTAEAFMVDEQTVSSWNKRIDEEGQGALVKINEPVNKYSDFHKYAVQQLKALVPFMGKRKIAEHFIRSGMTLAASSVGRIVKSATPDKPFMPDPEVHPEEEIKVVTSRHPDHTWMIDLTVVPTHFGMHTEWEPESLPQLWPFCWWVAVVIDHFSRKVKGILAFPAPPSSEQITDLLGKIISNTGKTPKYIISDKGMQFHPPKNSKHPEKHPYRKFCNKFGIKPRYGAIGKYGSIAIMERFMKTLKNECTRRISVPMGIHEMQEELVLFILWYNEYRPHSAFMKKQNKCDAMGPRTPQEVYDGFQMLKMPNAPPEKINNCDLPPVKINISYFEGRKHLPIVEIKKAA